MTTTDKPDLRGISSGPTPACGCPNCVESYGPEDSPELVALRAKLQAPPTLTFSLTITLGSDMTQDDIVYHLQSSLGGFYGFESDKRTLWGKGDRSEVDIDGNTVGWWGVA